MPDPTTIVGSPLDEIDRLENELDAARERIRLLEDERKDAITAHRDLRHRLTQIRDQADQSLRAVA